MLLRSVPSRGMGCNCGSAASAACSASKEPHSFLSCLSGILPLLILHTRDCTANQTRPACPQQRPVALPGCSSLPQDEQPGATFTLSGTSSTQHSSVQAVVADFETAATRKLVGLMQVKVLRSRAVKSKGATCKAQQRTPILQFEDWLKLLMALSQLHQLIHG